MVSTINKMIELLEVMYPCSDESGLNLLEFASKLIVVPDIQTTEIGSDILKLTSHTNILK